MPKLRKMDDIVTIKIQSLVYGGYGLSRLPTGKAVFVPFVLPGETVRVQIIEEKRGHAQAKLLEIIEPHTQRIKPRCGHYGLCGGCHYQHIPYDLQTKYKEQIFIEQLQRIAGVETPIIKDILPSPKKWGYRDTLQFSLGREGKLCFADFYTNSPFEVQECHLPMSEVGALWPRLEFEPGAELERIEIRQDNAGELMLILRGSGNTLPAMEIESSASVIHLSGSDQVILGGDAHLLMTVLEKDFRLSAGAFFQTNLGTSEFLVNEVVRTVRQYGCRSIMDVYCGVGLFSAFLAGEVDQLLGIEFSPTACEDFAVNLDDYDNVSLYQGKAEFIIPMINFRPDTILVDPPRSGLKKEVTQAIIEKAPHLLLYVSCNPSTLARDAKHLIQAGYHLESSVMVDMFPQTFHIESINAFIRTGS